MTTPVTPAIKAAAACGGVAALCALADTPLKRMILPYMWEFWLRPEQVLPASFKICLLQCGRGWGKTFAIAVDLVQAVMAGNVSQIALVGPNEERTLKIQIKALVEVSPPWFKPVQERNGLTWPNGIRAECFTAESPEKIRGDNISHAWATEVLAWPVGPDSESKRLKAFRNLTTATRKGAAKVYVDTTARGRNDVIDLINKMCAEDPRQNVIIRGGLVDNPLYSPEYLRSQFMQYVEGTRRFEEELNGAYFGDVAGALWNQETLDRTRRMVAPEPLDLVIIGLDPAYSDRPDADETGIVVVGKKGRETFVTRDLSGRLDPSVWPGLVVSTAIAMRATGVIVEVNATNLVPSVMRSACATHGLVMRELARDAPFPPWAPGVLHVKTVLSRTDKASRAAGPAGESHADRLHMVGHHEALEAELTSYDPGSQRQSPGRLDAMVHAVNELAELARDAPIDAGPGVVGAAVLNKALFQALAAGGARRVGM
jgi:phage terminase large subunit-like protein